jgi:hypothetical protein
LKRRATSIVHDVQIGALFGEQPNDCGEIPLRCGMQGSSAAQVRCIDVSTKFECDTHSRESLLLFNMGLAE